MEERREELFKEVVGDDNGVNTTFDVEDFIKSEFKDVEAFIKSEFKRAEEDDAKEKYLNITSPNGASHQVNGSNLAVIPNMSQLPTPMTSSNFSPHQNNFNWGVKNITDGVKLEKLQWAIVSSSYSQNHELILFKKTARPFRATDNLNHSGKTGRPYKTPIKLFIIGLLLAMVSPALGFIAVSLWIMAGIKLHRAINNTEIIFNIPMPSDITQQKRYVLTQALNENISYMGRENLEKIIENLRIDYANNNTNTIDYIINSNLKYYPHLKELTSNSETPATPITFQNYINSMDNVHFETTTTVNNNETVSAPQTTINLHKEEKTTVDEMATNAPIIIKLSEEEEYREVTQLMEKLISVKQELSESDSHALTICLSELNANGNIYLKAKTDGIGYDKIKGNFSEVTQDILQLLYGIEGNLIESRENQVKISNIFIKDKLGK